MKMPSFSQDAAVNFLLRHGEKIVVSLVAVLAMGLAWGGIDALRTQTVTADKRPEALNSHASRTLAHIDREKQPPADVAPKTPSLTKLVEPWRAPQIAAAPEMALLDSPLFNEMGKRTKPDVFPIENVQATAGIVVLAPKSAAAGMPGRPLEAEPPKPKTKTGKSKGKKQTPEEELAAGGPPGFGGGMGFGGAGPGLAGDGTAAMPPGKIVPYVVVTGLIPVAKQTGDYAQRFRSTSLRDPKRDSPLWSDYLVERSVIVPGGRETWERIDLKAVAKRARDQWAGVQAETMPPEFLLGPEQHPGSGGIGYCLPLPQLAMESWGAEALHPWFRRELDRLRAEREAAEKQAAERIESGEPPAGDAGAASPLAEQPADIGPPGLVQPGMPVDAMGRPVNALEYRLFRFVDTAVEPGKSYRYRVRLSVWNPNYNVPGQHLTDASLAKDAKLPSPPSNVTEPVTVPSTVTVLVRTLPKTDMKRYKPGMAEVLVLGPDDRTGNFALRSVITDLGGFVNVDRKLNKTGDQRVRGEEIFTNGLVVDMVGRQENRDDLKMPKNAGPPEPLELLVMREDGGFDLVTAADSQAAIDRYAVTLPAGDEAKPGAKQSEEPGPGQPSDAPFSFPGLGPR